MGKEVYLTQDGYQKLELRLDDLIANKRMEVAERIKIAREYGDLSENAEYDAAKDEQAMLEVEIKTIEEQLAHAIIISEATGTDVVSIGVWVKVLDMEFNDETEYQIVGATEADISANRISNDSPIAQAIMGKKVNDVANVVTPQSKFSVKILGIRV